MIGVIAKRADASVVRELFELFKTPWEFYRDGSHYDVLLCSGDAQLERPPAPLVITYTVPERPARNALSSGCELTEQSVGTLSYNGERLPVYCGSATFNESVVSSTLRFGILAASAV